MDPRIKGTTFDNCFSNTFNRRFDSAISVLRHIYFLEHLHRSLILKSHTLPAAVQEVCALFHGTNDCGLRKTGSRPFLRSALRKNWIDVEIYADFGHPLEKRSIQILGPRMKTR